MTHRPALAAAIGLTAFLLTLAAGMLYQLSVPDATVASAETLRPSLGRAAVQPATSVDQAAPTVAITADQAAAAATRSARNNRLLRAPELVNFQGSVAYEVTLAGGMVYIDANTGAVLYNGTSAAHGEAHGSGEHGHDSEHGTEHGSIFGLFGDHDDD
jgi:hypothetical protein